MNPAALTFAFDASVFFVVFSVCAAALASLAVLASFAAVSGAPLSGTISFAVVFSPVSACAPIPVGSAVVLGSVSGLPLQEQSPSMSAIAAASDTNPFVRFNILFSSF